MNNDLITRGDTVPFDTSSGRRTRVTLTPINGEIAMKAYGFLLMTLSAR